MSAPDTNIERQEANHKPALIGIKGAIVFGALMLLCAIFYAVINGQAPGDDGNAIGLMSNGSTEQAASFDRNAPAETQSN